MRLKDQLGLKKGFDNEAHETLLNVYYTGACLRKRFTEMLRPHGLTDVQLNLLMLLKHQADENGGLSQVVLSRMMLVNRANISALIDRTEKAGFVRRHPVSGDKRLNTVKLTERGAGLLAQVSDEYYREIATITGEVSPQEQRKLMRTLEKIRTGLVERSVS